MECGGVLVQHPKVQVTPTRGQNIGHAAPLPHAQLGTLVLIFVLDAGYDMHTYGAFSHKMRLAAKGAALLLYFSKIWEYLTCGGDPYPEGWSCVHSEIRILRVGRVF